MVDFSFAYRGKILLKNIEGLRPHQQLAINVETWAAENAQVAPLIVQLANPGMGLATIVASFKSGLVQPGIGRRLNKVISISPKQLALIFVELIVNLPEDIDILPANAIGRGMGINAGLAVIEHGPINDAHLAGFDIVGDDFLLST
jgi:hypothetical protein